MSTERIPKFLAKVDTICDGKPRATYFEDNEDKDDQFFANAAMQLRGVESIVQVTRKVKPTLDSSC